MSSPQEKITPTPQKVALVTGSSGGIGRAIAVRLAKDGFYILAHYNSNRDAALKTAELIEQAGGHGQILQFNVTDRADIEAKLEPVMRDLGPLSVLVNNAGVTRDNLLGLMSDEAFDDVLRTNTYGPFYLMRWAVKRMIRLRAGSIVNISSLAGQTGNPGQINYAASKGALIAMTKTLAMEVASRNIRVNAVSPGLIETEMVEGIPQIAEFVKRVPLGRIGQPDEVAGAVSFLCSADAAYVTGHTLSVNGGLFPT